MTGVQTCALPIFERQRPGAAASLVAMGISPALADGEVAQRLLAGSRGLVPEHLRGELGALRAARLLSKRRVAARGEGAQSGEAGADGTAGEAGGSQGGVEAVPTRSVRVFLPGPVLKRFLQLGFMKLGGVVVRIREYTPPPGLLWYLQAPWQSPHRGPPPQQAWGHAQ